ncbi:MAG: hypothetical protein AAGA91_17460 [Pseudomonadota bacterium]
MSILSAAITLIVLVCVLQVYRYERLRRTSAQDQQVLFHRRDVFHLMIFFRVRDGDRLVDSVAQFLDLLAERLSYQLVYCGQAGFFVPSEQLEEHRWDGLLVLQLANREDYQQRFAAQMPDLFAGVFADVYMHGMHRNRRFGVSIPLLMLRMRIVDLLQGRWQAPELKPMMLFKTDPEFEIWRQRVRRLHAIHEVNPSGLVVYHLVKHDAAQSGLEDDLNKQLLMRMATLGHGPIHIGSTIAVEGNARFDRVYAVLYPSANYYAELIGSEFFQWNMYEQPIMDRATLATVPITEAVSSAFSREQCAS